ncbi:MAG: hypothetical protein JXR41_06155 [Bacteroidales bacterium]|nr:hypothetical protein [Bacteroidales bacterium]MBN2762653.1 hypothetical protein [Bacteroidales bacterium]
MTTWNSLMEILKYILPSLVVFLTTWYLASRYFRSEDEKRRQQMALNNQNLITPLRLQAYERIILFLERINPESLVMRFNKHGMTCQQLQNELLTAIRAEFEHNLSQQIYISNQGWEMLKNAKNSTIQLIHLTADNFKSDEPSINLSKAILEKMIKEKKNPASEAIIFIKNEINRLF